MFEPRSIFGFPIPCAISLHEIKTVCKNEIESITITHNSQTTHTNSFLKRFQGGEENKAALIHSQLMQ